MFKKFGQIIAIVAVLATLVTLPVQAAASHSITGTILLNGKGLKGVVVTIQGTALTSTTNGLGDYAIHNVPIGSGGTIVSGLANYSFSPVNILFINIQANLVAQNFTATQLKAITYSISCTVTNGAAGLAGVSVTFGTMLTTTAANGSYSFSGIPAETRGRIVAKLTGYAFTPASITVKGMTANLAGQNFTSAAAYTISGKVTETGTGLPLAGVTITLGTFHTVTSATGTYTIRNVPAGTSGVLTPTLAGKTFTPPTINIPSVAASVHGQNFVAAP